MADPRDLILGLCPFERTDAALVEAVSRAGGLGILDLGRDATRAAEALARLEAAKVPFGVRVPEGITAPTLPESAATVLVDAGGELSPFAGRRVLVQVTSEAEALAALAAGAGGLVAKGHESGGRVGEEGSFVLLQRLRRRTDKPIWVQGGVGLRTAAACIAGGATGVVLDAGLALVRESTLPESVKGAVGAMDGSETELRGGYRVYARPNLPVDALAAGLPGTLGAGETLEDALLPAGQDAAFAASLAKRFGTAGALVRGLAEAIGAHLRQAKAVRPLAPGAGVARTHGLRYPVAQGPMTRVSDVPAFAEAVSAGGGLPFLALSLMRGDRAREVLEETKARLGEAPWGVGILGFVPPELRAEQLAAIEAVRPPAALIAGGRPAQARSLEAAGIPTFLHVPSPGLLELFLKDGARRFVFEGRECGGHVGPRTSFVLWEAQVERLLAFDDLAEVEVLFAGGIHDAASAAMVAALAAPLAARGARIGVLMGTAYLFTEEAVTTGAIKPGFQAAALSCAETRCLQTAPGHATRCVDGPYVRHFEATRKRLEAEGRAADEVWAELETLNLGRLRIAAKGVRRDGDALVDVDEATQAEEGMFMIGQVAALRDRVVSVEALHASVTAEATDRLEAVEIPGPLVDRPRPRPAEVAIVGMACFYPGSPDVHTFWANIVDGTDCVTEVPKARWNPDIYYDPESNDGRKTPSKWGGFLSPVDFDPLDYGIPPNSLAAVEPVQLLALEAAKRALADAGYDRRDFDGRRASVIFGAEAGTDLASAYGFRGLWPGIVGTLPEALDEALPTLTEDSFPGVLANVIAGRIANRLDLGGVNYTVDAACASSIAALDLSVKELRAGQSDLVLCGGADLHNAIGDYLLFASTHALSRRGRCMPFDGEADGIALGEGVAVVVLKRLEDAERDGDRIYAVVKGVAGSSDGRALGLTAPRKEGQMRAVERAYEMAGVSPAEVGLVEAHGTGTVVGDRTELATLTEVFGAAGARPASVTLGSVKSNIGHTKCAAGLAGVIKASLALHHRVRPPTIHVEEPNPAWDPDTSPFTLLREARPWLGETRYAGVSAFGFGGTNFHAVLAAYDGEAPVTGRRKLPAELFLVRDAADLDRLARQADAELPVPLRDLAASVARRGEGPVKVALVAASHEDLAKKVAAAKAGTEGPGCHLRKGDGDPGPLAFLFPGQGAQRPGMLADLFVAFPRLQAHLERGARWADRILPPTAYDPARVKAQRAAITDTRVAQPALGVVELACAELLGRLGMKPAMLAGHSYGELVALTVAGSMSEGDLLALSEARAEAILGAAGDDPGTMAAAAAPKDEVLAALGPSPEVVLANLNAPRQTVIAGPTPAVEAAIERLGEAGIGAKGIPVACAFHSPVVAAAEKTLLARLAEVPLAAPTRPVYSNTLAAPHDPDPGALRKTLAAHVARPVRFVEEIEAMYAAGARTFVEVGPGRILSGLVGKILGDRPHLVVPLDGAAADGVTALLEALAILAAAGVPVDPAVLFEGRAASDVDLETAPVRRPSVWQVDGHRARPVAGPVPAHGLRPIPEPLGLAVGGADAGPGPGENALVEYLRGVRSLAEGQRDVMLAWLGTEAPPRPRTVDVTPAAETRALAVPADGAGAEALAEAAPDAGDLAPGDVLLEIVSERTGYPVAMLDLDLDLEADLSIDSIKRIEILGVLSERLGLGGGSETDRDAVVEALAGVKTLRGILTWLEGQSPEGGAAAETAAIEAPATETKALPSATATAPADGGDAPSADGAGTIPERTTRYVWNLAPAPEPLDAWGFAGRRIVITADDRGLAAVLAGRLGDAGAEVAVLADGDDPGACDALVLLHTLGRAPDLDPGRRLFAVADLARRALESGASVVLAATALGGRLGLAMNGHDPLAAGGLAGLVKTMAKEWTDARVRCVDLDPEEAVEALVTQLVAELRSDDGLVEVGWHRGTRLRLEPVVAGPSEAAPFDLDGDAVVLLTGGARGITARVARALAERHAPTLILLGRSERPAGTGDPDLAGARTAIELRGRLVALGRVQRPAEADRLARRILADREIRETLAALEAAGARVEYHAVDVRDPEAFGALLDDVLARHGRLDLVIHGAGVNEDKLLRHKTEESFRRVFDTKVTGALTLAERLPPEPRLVFFSSIASAFGNRGQGDYAAANDVLDKLALALHGHRTGRVVSVNWGPWAGGGMVTPELEAEYDRRGIGLIDPEDGVDRLLEEIATGDGPQVILMRAHPDRLR